MKTVHVYVDFLIFSLMAGCNGKSSSPQARAEPAVFEVTMKDMQFTPSYIEINEGDTVEWKNADIIPHTATSPAFGDSGSLQTDERWRHVFAESGDFPYACTFHPNMTGTVMVK